MNISYDHYRIFYYVAKCRSATQASRLLLSSQPNVTRAIKNLEAELGCTLFVRSRHGMLLTPEGEKLFAHVRIAVEHIEAGEEEMTRKQSIHQGFVRIGASEVALHCLLLPTLKAYRQLYPDVRIRVSNHSTPQALEALKNGLVDLAVVTTPMDLSDAMVCTPIRPFQEVPVCGSAFAFLSGQERTLAQLAEHPLICLGEQTKTFAFYEALFRRSGVAFSPSVEAATTDQIIPLVANDLGIGFVPRTFLEHWRHTEAIHVLRLREQIPQRQVCLVTRAGATLSIAARELEAMLRREQQGG